MAQPQLSVALPPTAKISYEDYLALAEEESSADEYEYEHTEWVNGEIVRMSPVTDEHSQVNNFLIAVIREYVELQQLGAVYSEPFQMKTGPNLPGRSPDVLFVAKERQERIKRMHLKGPADLAVEIISKDSPKRDAVDKFQEYETGGVREYWLIDPKYKKVTFYRLGANGKYEPVAVGDDDIYRSEVLSGLWLNVDWLWQRPLPPVLTVLKAWGLI